MSSGIGFFIVFDYNEYRKDKYRKKCSKMKKKIMLLALVMGGSLLVAGCGNKELLIKENLNFEINSDLKLLSLVSDDNEAKIVSKDATIDTSALGEQEVTIEYEKDGETAEKTFNIMIVDTTKPEIEVKNETISSKKGKKVNLLKDVTVTDNSKEEIKATVEGEYDIKKVGEYKLKYVAKDSSGNTAEKEFTLKVTK